MATHHPTLEYLTTAKIGEKGQLTVPKQFREDLRLGADRLLLCYVWAMVLILLPEQQCFEHLCQQVGHVLLPPVLLQGTFWPLFLRLVAEFSRGAMGRTLRTSAHDAVLAKIARSDEPTQNSGCSCQTWSSVSDGRSHFGTPHAPPLFCS